MEKGKEDAGKFWMNVFGVLGVEDRTNIVGILGKVLWEIRLLSQLDRWVRVLIA